jgi:HD-GYP domain-containing protein (c-di-GMP phosphodiesterase class II)
LASLVLNHPVQTLDNKVLLPAGTDLSGTSLETLLPSHDAHNDMTFPLMDHGSVKRDIVDFVHVSPYSQIFSDEDTVSDVLADMENIHLIAPALECLDYFRQNDYYSYRHFLLVFSLSSILAKELIPNYQDLLHLAATGPTHDIGKICVPLDILKKTTPLTRNEVSIMEGHSLAGYVLLGYYLGDSDSLAARVARDHHERADGSGYPRGIMLDDLMVEIIAASDVYDALISPRPYRAESYENRTALEELTLMAEQGEISWKVVKLLVAKNRKTKPHLESFELSAEKRGNPPEGNIHGIIAEEEGGSGDA